jgi:hypothetical protein
MKPTLSTGQVPLDTTERDPHSDNDSLRSSVGMGRSLSRCFQRDHAPCLNNVNEYTERLTENQRAFCPISLR